MITTISIEFVFANPMNKYDTTHITLSDNMQGRTEDPEQMGVVLYNIATEIYKRIADAKIRDKTPGTIKKEIVSPGASKDPQKGKDDLPF